VLTAVFGEQAVRDLAREARQNLLARLEELLAHDRTRFDALIGDSHAGGAALTEALDGLRASR
jgi:hypothetical protein